MRRKVREKIHCVGSKLDVEDAAEFILNFYVGVIHLLSAFDRVQGIFLYFESHFLLPKMGFEGRFHVQAVTNSSIVQDLGDKYEVMAATKIYKA